MKKILAGLLFIGGIFMAKGQIVDLGQYRWKQRVLLIFAPDAAHSVFQQQMVEINQAKDGYVERDLIVITISMETIQVGEDNPFASSSVAHHLHTEFKVSEDDFCAILLGKDGGIKLRSTKVIPSNHLFDVIDAMPMRQREMNRHK